jgi:hypothetical protein
MPFTPRPIVLLALAVMAAAPAAAQQTSGGSGATRPVDECGSPEALPKNRRTSQRRSGDGSAHAARPAPRLLGQPAASAGEAQPGDAGQQASAGQPAAPSASGTAAQGSTQPAGASTNAGGATVQAGQAGQQLTGAHAHAANPPAAGATSGTASQGAAQQTQGQPSQPAGASSTAATAQPGGAQPVQASSTRADSAQILTAAQPGAQGSATTGNTPSYSGTSADVDPGAARRNRGLLRLQGTGRGTGLRLGPAASVSVPTAFGVDAGEMFFGVAYQGRTRYTDEDDAAAVAGIGIGSRRVLALEAAITTYSTFRGTPLETGGLSFKLHRQLPRQTSVAIGWENAILWGGADDRGSLYASATRLLSLREDPAQPFSTAVVTLGLGNGRFRFESDDAADRERINVFGALGVRVTGPVSLVTDWTGQDLNLAASITPIRRVPFVVTAGIADVTGQAGDGARFILSLGYGLSLRQPL